MCIPRSKCRLSHDSLSYVLRCYMHHKINAVRIFWGQSESDALLPRFICYYYLQELTRHIFIRTNISFKHFPLETLTNLLRCDAMQHCAACRTFVFYINWSRNVTLIKFSRIFARWHFSPVLFFTSLYQWIVSMFMAFRTDHSRCPFYDFYYYFVVFISLRLLIFVYLFFSVRFWVKA